MITPDYLSEVALGTEDAVSRLNEKLIKQIARSIQRAFEDERGELIIPSTVADMGKVARSGYSVQQVQALIEKELPEIRAEVRQAFNDSAREIADYLNEYTDDLASELGVAVDLPSGRAIAGMTALEITILENAFKRTNGEIRNLTNTGAEAVYKTYIQGCDNAYFKVQAGMSPNKAISQAVDEIAKKGIQAVQYPTGKTDSIDVAVARAVRTGVNQANSEIVLQRCAELGVGYVKTSQHLGARVTKEDDYTNHSWWQGKVYSLDWSKEPLKCYEYNHEGEFPQIRDALSLRNVGKYPDFVETCGYGKLQGIIGINCRHTFVMWVPGLNVITDEPIDQKKNEQRYRTEQTMRAYEREIRKLKREEQAQKALGSEEARGEAKRIHAMLNDRIIQYQAYCADHGVAPYWERTRA